VSQQRCPHVIMREENVITREERFHASAIVHSPNLPPDRREEVYPRNRAARGFNAFASIAQVRERMSQAPLLSKLVSQPQLLQYLISHAFVLPRVSFQALELDTIEGDHGHLDDEDLELQD
jgi:hypothetical protein